MIRCFFLSAVLALSLISGGAKVASARPVPHRVTYSSLCTEAESGDAAGYQIMMDETASPPSVSFDWSEGGLMEPVKASDVSYDRQSGALRFNADANGRTVSFSGRIAGPQLTGTLTWIDNPGDAPQRERVYLRRVRKLDLRPRCELRHPRLDLNTRPLRGLVTTAGHDP
jgi:hypothetical protein